MQLRAATIEELKELYPDNEIKIVKYDTEVTAWGGREIHQTAMFLQARHPVNKTDTGYINLFPINRRGERVGAAMLQIPMVDVPELIKALKELIQ